MGPERSRHARIGDPGVTYDEGSQKVGDWEISWRIPRAVRMTPDWSEGAAPADVVPFGDPVIEMVSLGPGTTDRWDDALPAVPTSFETTITDGALGRRYQFVIDVDNEGPAVTEFLLSTAEGFDAPRSATELKKIPYRKLLVESLAAVGRAEQPDLAWRQTLKRDDIEAARRPRGGRRPVHDLTRVAELHREANDANAPASRHIARKMDVTAEHARQLIMRARRAGLIAPPGEES